MKTNSVTPRSSYAAVQKFRDMNTAATAMIKGGGTELPKATVKKRIVLPMVAGLMIASGCIGATTAAGKLAAIIVKNDFSLSKTFNAITQTLSSTKIK